MKTHITLTLKDIEDAIKTKILTSLGPEMLRQVGDSKISFQSEDRNNVKLIRAHIDVETP